MWRSSAVLRVLTGMTTERRERSDRKWTNRKFCMLIKFTYQSPRAVDGGWSCAAAGRCIARRTLRVHLAVYMSPLVAPNGLEMSRPASQGQYRAETDTWLAGSAPSSC